MLCPHCGKETGEIITFNAALPNLNNGCNPIMPTFQPFNWNFNAAAGCNPTIDYTVLNPGACGAAALTNVQQITLNFQ